MLEIVTHISACSPLERRQWTAAAQALVADIPPVFRPDVLKARRWVCVAMEDELERETAARLAQACAAHGFAAGWSLEFPWEPGDWVPTANHVALSPAGLEAVSKDVCIGSCFVLVEALDRFAVTSDGDLYCMLAGPRPFVEAALGTTVEAQLLAFGKNVEDYGASGARFGSILRAVQAVAVAACAHSKGPA